jgi:REP-associated tyrosine transposase
MPRLPRYAAPGTPQHVIQRGNNRCALFARHEDYLFFRECLRAACERHRCRIHAYVFMTNHVHLLVTPESDSGLSRVMQSVGRRYVRYFNDLHGRTGTLWEGRYRASLVQTDPYLLACYRYIELNPVRAGLTTHPRDYAWSSHHANAFGREDPMVILHESYTALGRGSRERQAAYRALFEKQLDDDTLNSIRAATNKGWALGSKTFRDEVAALLGHRTQPISAGRSAMQRFNSTLTPSAEMRQIDSTRL